MKQDPVKVDTHTIEGCTPYRKFGRKVVVRCYPRQALHGPQRIVSKHAREILPLFAFKREFRSTGLGGNFEGVRNDFYVLSKFFIRRRQNDFKRLVLTSR